MIKPVRLLICALMVPLAGQAKGAEEVKSPDGRIGIEISINELQQPTYAVSFKDETVIQPGRLGMRFRDHAGLDQGFEIVSRASRSHDATWEQPWGERRLVRDRYNEALVTFHATSPPAREFSVRFRAYDDGVGFRYEIPEQSGDAELNVVDELTEFRLPRKATAWWIPGRGWNRYEYLYRRTPAEAVNLAHTPMTVRLPSGIHLSLHEAALVDYAAYVLDQRRPGVFQANLTPWSDGIRVKARAPFKSPWRTIQIAPDAVGLLNSSLILNLNEPNRLGNVDWVKPGKYVGIWWAMHIKRRTWSSGPTHGATTEETKRYMDFAAEHGFSGVLVEGWNKGWDGEWFHNGDLFSFTEPYPDFDLQAVTDYGRELGVELIGHHETSGNVTNYEQQMGAAFELYERHGVHQVKTGYVADGGDIKRIDATGLAHYEWHDGQFMVDHYLRSVREAAKHRIAINTHEPVKDTGLRRTYPNWIAREGARGQEFNAWDETPNPPEHTATLPYTRLLAGPMDFTPGIFDLTFAGPDANNRVQTTLAKQLALYVVLYSPIQMAADLPENYARNPAAFQFIVDVPTDWEDSQALAGEVGDYVVFARAERDGPDWYLGAVTDEIARSPTIPLTFLDPDVSYVAEIYRDGDDAHWRTNPSAISIQEQPVDQSSELLLPMAPGGGMAVRFRAQEQP